MRAAPAPAALAALALAGCGEDTLDAGRAERFVRGVVVEKIGARVGSVVCPEGLRTEAGATFTCSVVGTDGSRGRVDVRQRDDDENIQVDAPLLHVREAETVIAGQMSRRLEAGAEVVCQEIVVVRRGERFSCTVRWKGRRRSVTARLLDDDGRFRYRTWRMSVTDARRPR
ncbi:MAG: DUF4333 domain-containing protein [Actinomycetota bacterium]|nr:DUF4333 domain-containing protein [Actinomycetota bacterium]